MHGFRVNATQSVRSRNLITTPTKVDQALESTISQDDRGIDHGKRQSWQEGAVLDVVADLGQIVGYYLIMARVFRLI